jgi:hypothetical protein
LDPYPDDTLGEGLFWKTKDHVKQALTGVYQLIRNDNAYGKQFLFDYLGDIAYGYDRYLTFPQGTHIDHTGGDTRPMALSGRYPEW